MERHPIVPILKYPLDQRLLCMSLSLYGVATKQVSGACVCVSYSQVLLLLLVRTHDTPPPPTSIFRTSRNYWRQWEQLELMGANGGQQELTGANGGQQELGGGYGGQQELARADQGYGIKSILWILGGGCRNYLILRGSRNEQRVVGVGRY